MMSPYSVPDVYLGLTDICDELVDGIRKIQSDEISKIINLGLLTKNLIAERDTYQKVVDELRDRIIPFQKKIIDKQRRIDNLKLYIENSMNDHDMKIIEDDYIVLKLKLNPPKVIIKDDDLITDEYKRYKTTVTVNKELIHDDLKNGVFIKWAYLEQGTKLEIK